MFWVFKASNMFRVFEPKTMFWMFEPVICFESDHLYIYIYIYIYIYLFIYLYIFTIRNRGDFLGPRRKKDSARGREGGVRRLFVGRKEHSRGTKGHQSHSLLAKHHLFLFFLVPFKYYNQFWNLSNLNQKKTKNERSCRDLSVLKITLFGKLVA